MSVLNQSGEEQVECPLCMEPLEVDDLNFYPCTCGYQICRFCWHRIRTDENGLCPACRKAYSEKPTDFTPLSQEQVAQLKAEKRARNQQRKARLNESRKHLESVRVVQKNLVFVVGLPVRLADPEILRRHEYFGKYGRIHKVVINQSTSYAGSQGPSASAYVTYLRSEDALRAIQSVNNIMLDGRQIKSSLGTTKYCSHFLKNQTCQKADCMYLHELGDTEASFTKEEMHQGKHQEYEKRLHEQLALQQQQKANNTKDNTNSTTGGTNGSSNSLEQENNIKNIINNGNVGNQKEAWPSLSRNGSPSNVDSGKNSGGSTSPIELDATTKLTNGIVKINEQQKTKKSKQKQNNNSNNSKQPNTDNKQKVKYDKNSLDDENDYIKFNGFDESINKNVSVVVVGGGGGGGSSSNNLTNSVLIKNEINLRKSSMQINNNNSDNNVYSQHNGFPNDKNNDEIAEQNYNNTNELSTSPQKIGRDYRSETNLDLDNSTTQSTISSSSSTYFDAQHHQTEAITNSNNQNEAIEEVDWFNFGNKSNKLSNDDNNKLINETQIDNSTILEQLRKFDNYNKMYEAQQNDRYNNSNATITHDQNLFSPQTQNTENRFTNSEQNNFNSSQMSNENNRFNNSSSNNEHNLFNTDRFNNSANDQNNLFNITTPNTSSTNQFNSNNDQIETQQQEQNLNSDLTRNFFNLNNMLSSQLNGQSTTNAAQNLNQLLTSEFMTSSTTSSSSNNVTHSTSKFTLKSPMINDSIFINNQLGGGATSQTTQSANQQTSNTNQTLPSLINSLEQQNMYKLLNDFNKTNNFNKLLLGGGNNNDTNATTTPPMFNNLDFLNQQNSSVDALAALLHQQNQFSNTPLPDQIINAIANNAVASNQTGNPNNFLYQQKLQQQQFLLNLKQTQNQQLIAAATAAATAAAALQQKFQTAGASSVPNQQNSTAHSGSTTSSNSTAYQQNFLLQNQINLVQNQHNLINGDQHNINLIGNQSNITQNIIGNTNAAALIPNQLNLMAAAAAANGTNNFKNNSNLQNLLSAFFGQQQAQLNSNLSAVTATAQTLLNQISLQNSLNQLSANSSSLTNNQLDQTNVSSNNTTATNQNLHSATQFLLNNDSAGATTNTNIVNSTTNAFVSNENNPLSINGGTLEDDLFIDQGDLNFDPIEESQKGFAEMALEDQMLPNSNLNQVNGGGQSAQIHNPGLTSLQQRARHPPPGFSHMNAFGIGLPRPQQHGSKILPFMGLNSSTNNTTNSTSNTQSNPTNNTAALNAAIAALNLTATNSQNNSSVAAPLSNWSNNTNLGNVQIPQQKNLGYCNDWTTLDPAIVSTSRHMPLAMAANLANNTVTRSGNTSSTQNNSNLWEYNGLQQQNFNQNVSSPPSIATSSSQLNLNSQQNDFVLLQNQYWLNAMAVAAANANQGNSNDVQGTTQLPPGFRPSGKQEC